MAPLAGALALIGAPAAAWAADFTECEMNFSLEGWSAIYKTSSGTGTVRCKNGQTAKVKLKSQGGGLSFGKQEIAEGKGTFSKVRDIEEIFGTYAAANVEAGASEAAGAAVMTKGEISLALSGTGRGMTIGFDFSGFTVERAK
jgi:hypothetical protein